MTVKNNHRYPKRGKPWTKEEHKRLSQLFPKYSSWRLMLEFGRTPAAIATRASRLGLKKDVSKGYLGRDSNWRIWTKREIVLLRMHYKKMTSSDIAALLDRSCGSVATKARNLGLRKAKVWTTQEKELLKKIYRRRPLGEVAQIFGRSMEAVSNQARKMEIAKKARRWTKAELKYLMKNWRIKTAEELSRRIRHSPMTIRGKFRALGLKKMTYWTQKEQQYLRRHYGKKGSRAIAEFLGKGLVAVKVKSQKMGLRRVYWTKEEDKEFKKLYPLHSNSWLSRKFKRHPTTLWEKGQKLGLSKKFGRKITKWFRKDIDFLSRHYKTMRAEDIAAALGKSTIAVRDKAVKLGIKKNKYPRHLQKYWTKEKNAEFRRLFPKKSNSWMARKFKRSIGGIYRKALKLGLRRKDKKILL
jgi:hypothetical protein